MICLRASTLFFAEKHVIGSGGSRLNKLWLLPGPFAYVSLLSAAHKPTDNLGQNSEFSRPERKLVFMGRWSM